MIQLTKVNILRIFELALFLGLFIAVIVLACKVNSKSQTDSKDIVPPISPKISINESIFGVTSDNEKVYKYVLKNNKNIQVTLISYGAAVQALEILDKNGKPTNIVLGFNTVEEYSDQKLNPYFGGIIGRVANRISNGEFKLDGKTYQLDRNNGNNTLHGGKTGFNWINWRSEIIEDGVKFKLVSNKGDGGFPGTLRVEVFYRLHYNGNTLLIEYNAETDEATPLDLTNHAYFNLGGEDSGEKIYNHSIKFYSDYTLDLNMSQVLVTGKVNSVDQTKYDLRNYTRLGDRIKTEGNWPAEGFDNYFISNQQSGTRIIASVKNPKNGIQMDIWSNQNGAQFYTANFLNLTKPSTNQKYKIHEGFCIETSNYPDAINKIVQVAGWITMAAALQNNSLNFSVSNMALTNVLIVRVLYLVIFVVGSLISIVVLALGLFDRSLGPVALVVVLDIVWAIGEITVSVFSALVEAYISGQYEANNTFYSRTSYYNWWYIFITNKGAFAVAAAFGFVAGLLNLASAFILVCPIKINNDSNRNSSLKRDRSSIRN